MRRVRGAGPALAVQGGTNGRTVMTTPHKNGLILFAHGARDPQWADPFRNIQERVKPLCPGTRVELAFLELMPPDLSSCVEQLVQAGLPQITLVPLFMAHGGHLKKDLPRMIGDIQARHPQCAIRVTQAIGESPGLLQAIAHWVAQSAALCQDAT